MYIRSAGGPDRPRYRRALGSGRRRIRAGGIEADVTFAETVPAGQAAIDAAQHAKHDRYGPTIGAGQKGQAIARRISAGRHVVLANLRQESADAAAEVLANAGFDVSTAVVDVSWRDSVHALATTPADEL